MYRRRIMSTKKHGRKAAALCLAGLCLLSAVSPVMAADYTESLIDTGRTASLTIGKYVNNDGNEVPGTGLEGQSVPEGSVPLAGVTFSYYKAAELTQIVSGTKASVYASSVSADLLALAERAGAAPAAVTVDGEAMYTTASLEKAVEAINAVPSAAAESAGSTQLTDLVRREGTAMAPTGADGLTRAEALPLGLYLIAETDVSAAEAAGSLVMTGLPHLLMLPMTNAAAIDGHAPGTVWQYDVTLYPKNRTLGIRKAIVSERDGGEVLVTADDRSIGETIRQIITADVPVLTGGLTNREYRIVDTMSEGLSFREINAVTIGSGAWNDPANVSLTPEVDYTVSSGDDRSVTITLTEQGRARLDAVAENSRLYVDFNGYLNGDAGVGTSLNTTTPTLTYATSASETRSMDGNTPHVADYELDITKLADAAGADLTQVVFTMAKEGDALSFVALEAGSYRLAEEGDDAEVLTGSLSPDAAGRLKIRGLDAAAYEIRETKTAPGLQLLTDTVSIILESPTEPDGSLTACYAGIGSEAPVKLTDNEGLLDGIASLTIENGKALAVPHTGGSGGADYRMAGLVSLAGIALAVSGAALRRRALRRRAR